MYKPKEIDGQFIWQCAYVDAIAYNHVLPGYIFDLLWKYRKYDRGCLTKHYLTENEALEALKEVKDLMLKQIENIP